MRAAVPIGLLAALLASAVAAQPHPPARPGPGADPSSRTPGARREARPPSDETQGADPCESVPVATSEVERPRPVLVCSPWLDWPEDGKGTEGVVTLRALVAEDGRVREVRIDGQATDARLVTAAIVNVKGRRYLPATRAGAAVPAWVDVRVVFRAPGDSPRPRRG